MFPTVFCDVAFVCHIYWDLAASTWNLGSTWNSIRQILAHPLGVLKAKNKTKQNKLTLQLQRQLAGEFSKDFVREAPQFLGLFSRLILLGAAAYADLQELRGGTRIRPSY